MQIDCRICGEEVAAENINPATMIATCPYCKAVFSAEQKPKREKARQDLDKTRIPEGLTLRYEKDYMLIESPWSRGVGCLAALIAIPFNFIGWGSLINGLLNENQNSSLSFFAFFGVLGAIGALGYLLNTTRIYVDRFGLKIRNGPIPISQTGASSVDIRGIKQLFTRQILAKKHRAPSTITYEVLAIGLDETVTSLVSNLADAEVALFIEEKIENYLGIENQKLEGEGFSVIHMGKTKIINRKS